MKKLYYTTAFLLAVATTANATVPIQEPPVISDKPVTVERESSGGGVDGLAIFGVLLGIVVINELSKRTTPPVDEPRPQVRPQTCMNKHGVFVVCPDES